MTLALCIALGVLFAWALTLELRLQMVTLDLDSAKVNVEWLEEEIGLTDQYLGPLERRLKAPEGARTKDDARALAGVARLYRRWWRGPIMTRRPSALHGRENFEYGVTSDRRKPVRFGWYYCDDGNPSEDMCHRWAHEDGLCYCDELRGGR
jgi:hypothetical protein